MAQTIAKAALMQQALDQAMIQDAVTGFMEENAAGILYNGGDEVRIPSVAMSALADYDRTDGFVEGDVTLAYQTMKLTQDRGRGFTVDAMDVDESGALSLMSMLAGEFQRTKVIPEVDAYRISRVTALAGAKRRGVYVPAAKTVLETLIADIEAVRDTVGDGEPLVVLLSGKVSALLHTSESLMHRLETQDFQRGELVTRVRSIDGVPLLATPSARMVSRITIAKDGAGGFAKASGAADVNWIVVARRAPLAVSKTDTLRLFDPQTYQKANAWHMDYRKFHDLWIAQNKLDGVRVSLAAQDTALDA